jgi:predicted phosphohydrolase
VRLAWTTDPHLNFLDAPAVEAFLAAVAARSPDAVAISGDIGESNDVEALLATAAARLPCPIYFVLGNHDYYRGSIAGVRRRIALLVARTPRLRYLSREGVVPLARHTALVGHDGWADARAGDWSRSRVMLNDYVCIEELAGIDPKTRRQRLQALGDEAAAHLRAVLPDALARFRRVIVLTHPPPFPEASWWEGRPSSPDYLPHFVCVAAGEVLRAAMAAHPERTMTVLCGHTHGEGEARPLPNLRVWTGAAVYGSPRVQQVIDVE